MPRYLFSFWGPNEDQGSSEFNGEGEEIAVNDAMEGWEASADSPAAGVAPRTVKIPVRVVPTSPNASPYRTSG